MTTFHVIHIIAGAWLILAPYLNILDFQSMATNSAVIGGVVLLYNLWYLFARDNVDVREER